MSDIGLLHGEFQAHLAAVAPKIDSQAVHLVGIPALEQCRVVFSLAFANIPERSIVRHPPASQKTGYSSST